MMPLTAIKSTRIVAGDEIINGFIILKGGIIEDIVRTDPAGEVIIHDAGENVVMAGIVDPHVHINEPGRTDWEGFDTATKAAMAGGVTSLIEMPLNASPVTTSAAAFETKTAAAKNKIHVNCGFWGGLIPGNEKQIGPLMEKGVFGFKAFLVPSGIDEFPNVTEADLRKAMPVLAKNNFPLLVHCELEDRVPGNESGTNSYADYVSSRPRSWEDHAISLMIRLCGEFNCRTHIVHLSSSSSIEQIIKAKEKGIPLTVETAQHYLYFNAEDIPSGRTEYKCAPPIRERENNEKLWQALKDGLIDFVATDHSPAPPGMKQVETGDLFKAWGGISSIQFSLPALWTAARKHNCTIIDMGRWLCANPALLPGLVKKGKIAKGYDADLVIWNPEKSFTVKKEDIHHRHKITPYLGEELFGEVIETWLRGEMIYQNQRFINLNKGQLLYNKL